MAIKYSAFLFYDANLDGVIDEAKGEGYMEIANFYVTGGASRIINLNKADDVNITSELEQARTFKNIVLAAKADMAAAVKLIDLSDKKTPLNIIITVEKSSGKKILQQLYLEAGEAQMTKRPSAAGTHLIMNLQLPTASLSLGKYQKKKWQVEDM